jgi:hypothetical protein
MKIVIRTEGSSVGREEVFVNAFGWSITESCIVMIRGIGDGYYDFAVKSSVIPCKVWFRHDHVLVHVARREDIPVLADDLRREDAFAHDSFSNMRV